MTIETVGVVGAGTMGSGVAQALAQAGYRVLLVDVAEQSLATARRAMVGYARVQGLLGHGKAPRDAEASLRRVTFSTDDAVLADAEFVVENVPEIWDTKAAVYARLDRVCAPPVVFAVNTSALSITRVASITSRPARVIGMHFMNPAPLMPMVELVRGHHTSDETIEIARALVAGMGKQSLVVNDSPGFVTNRVMMLTINEAIFLRQEGVAATEDIDRLFKTCFGHKMGPLETADLIGLDTILYSLQVLYDAFNDDKYRPSTLLKRMVDAGLHGRKTGEGFYRYGQMIRHTEGGRPS